MDVLRRNKEKQFSITLAEAPDDFDFMHKFMIQDSDDDFLFHMPGMKGLRWGDFDPDVDKLDDMDELEDEIDELKDELKKLKQQLKKIESKLE
jgi:hypothetical protein